MFFYNLEVKLKLCGDYRDVAVAQRNHRLALKPLRAPVAAPEPAAEPVVEEGVEIVSPMVGTYYPSPDPDSPSFIEVGDTVSEDTTVCIIEAMKIFNEIKAQCSGTVTKILVANGEPVEFGQPLFLVKQ